jgi:FMN hydrolase / 5-amino-6-(5-phospho-D-ribitylamino)uracil phosphatase
MQRAVSRSAAAIRHAPPNEKGAVILCFDCMDTLVKDPFFTVMPQFFGMSFKELLSAKHPTAWPSFERGQISESELFENFFIDRRPVDGLGLKKAMLDGYEWLPGMEGMLFSLRDAGYECHALSNYPSWWQMIESKLRVSQYLTWSFISCEGPMKVRDNTCLLSPNRADDDYHTFDG